MTIAEDQPFEETQLEQGKMLVTFAQRVDHARTRALDDKCLRWVDDNNIVIMDLSATVSIVSRWLKFLVRLSDRARDSGKRVVLVGVSDDIKQTADYLGIEDAFVHAGSVEEARRS